MIEQVIDVFLYMLGGYVFLGILFSLYFVFKGAEKLDAGVKNTPWHFRLIIFPGSVMLWIVLFYKLQQKKS